MAAFTFLILLVAYVATLTLGARRFPLWAVLFALGGWISVVAMAVPT